MGKNQEDLNPKAREAFAKSCIDVGVAIFKSVLLVVFILPMTLVAKAVFDSNQEGISIVHTILSIDSLTWLILLAFIVLGMLAGFFYRDNGLKILDDMENEEI